MKLYAVYKTLAKSCIVLLAKCSSLQLHKAYPWAEVIMLSETVG